MYNQKLSITTYLLFVFLTVLTITGCDTSSPDIEEPMWAQVNQSEWIADEISYHGSITFSDNNTSSDHTIIYGTSTTNGRIALYTMEPISTSGTYSILLKDTSNPSYYWPHEGGFENVFHAITGEVVVTNNEEGQLNGSFNLTGETKDGRTVVIADGFIRNLEMNEE